MTDVWPSGRWNITVGDEVLFDYFEDIRKQIWRIYKTRLGMTQSYAAYDDEVAYDQYDCVEWPVDSGNFWCVGDGSGTNAGDEPGVSGKWFSYINWDYYSDWDITSSKCYYKEISSGGNYATINAWQMLPYQLDPYKRCESSLTEWSSASVSYVVGDIRKKEGTRNKYHAYICYAPNTSTTTNGPGMAGGEAYWKPYPYGGKHYEVCATEGESRGSGSELARFISNNIGPQFSYTPAIFEFAYYKRYEDPRDTDSSKYFEYQSAIERAASDIDFVAPHTEDDDSTKYYDLNDIVFNCNGAGFEKALELMGEYCWFLDTTYYPADGDGHALDDGSDETIDAHPVWRKTWRHTMLTPSHFNRLRLKDSPRNLKTNDDWYDAGWLDHNKASATWFPVGSATWTNIGTVDSVVLDESNNRTRVNLIPTNGDYNFSTWGGYNEASMPTDGNSDPYITIDSVSYVVESRVLDAHAFYLVGDQTENIDAADAYSFNITRQSAIDGFIKWQFYYLDEWPDDEDYDEDYQTCVYYHNLAYWHGNPTAILMNDMKAVLAELDTVNLDSENISIQQRARYAENSASSDVSVAAAYNAAGVYTFGAWESWVSAHSGSGSVYNINGGRKDVYGPTWDDGDEEWTCVRSEYQHETRIKFGSLSEDELAIVNLGDISQLEIKVRYKTACVEKESTVTGWLFVISPSVIVGTLSADVDGPIDWTDGDAISTSHNISGSDAYLELSTSSTISLPSAPSSSTPPVSGDWDPATAHFDVSSGLDISLVSTNGLQVVIDWSNISADD